MMGAVVSNFAGLLVQGLLSPRPVMRRLLDGGFALPEAAMMVVLAHILASILHILTPGIEPLGGDSSITMHVVAIASQLLVFGFMSIMIFWLGRSAGGKGTFPQTQIMVAWHTLITSFLTPPIALFMSSMQGFRVGENSTPPEIPGMVVILSFVAICVWFWLLAQYITELHGYRSALGVLAVVVGIPFLAVFLLMTLSGGMA